MDDETEYSQGDLSTFGGRVWEWRGTRGVTGSPLTTAKWSFQRHSRATWDPAETYYRMDIVIHQGRAWLALRETTGQEPPDTVPTAPQPTAADQAANKAREDLINRLYDALSVDAMDMQLAIQCFLSATMALHGPDGLLNRLIFPENVVETWTGLTANDRVIRPWERPTTGTVFIEWQDGAEALRGRLSVGQAMQARDGRIYISRDADFTPEATDIVVISYRASGIAPDMTSLPGDLESAIFAKARQLFDFRNSYSDTPVQRIPWQNMILNRYRRKPS